MARDEMSAGHESETATVYADWTRDVQDGAQAAGTPVQGAVEEAVSRERTENESVMDARRGTREARSAAVEQEVESGRGEVGREQEKPLVRSAAESVLGTGFATKLFGTADNHAPDGDLDRAANEPDEETAGQGNGKDDAGEAKL